eukprot:1236236-Rhodomonas_salina.1
MRPDNAPQDTRIRGESSASSMFQYSLNPWYRSASHSVRQYAAVPQHPARYCSASTTHPAFCTAHPAASTKTSSRMSVTHPLHSLVAPELEPCVRRFSWYSRARYSVPDFA